MMDLLPSGLIRKRRSEGGGHPRLVGRKPRRAKDIERSVGSVAPGLSRAVDLVCSRARSE